MKNNVVAFSLLFSISLLSCTQTEQEPEPQKLASVECMSNLSPGCEGFRADVNGISLYFEIHGEGEPLLLLHGGTGFIETFAPQLLSLAAHYKVIAPDSRGHGRSSDTGDALSYTQMAQDFAGLLDLLEIEQAHIVGWSDGGISGLEMAINKPDRVNKVVIIGTNFNPDGIFPQTKEYLLSIPADEWSPEVVDFYKANSPHPEQWPAFLDKVKTMWMTQPEFTEDELGRIQSPFLVMAGENEEFIAESHTRKMADLIPDARLVLIPGGTHFVPVEKPEKVNAHILEFLSE